MPGPIALVGSGEFTPALEPVDRRLLDASGRKHPRVVILPTASAPDGEEMFQRWVRMGRDHFESLGAQVEPLLVRERDDALDPVPAQVVVEADLVYLSGGKPDHLYDVLRDTPIAGRDAGRLAARRGAGRLLRGRDGARRAPDELRGQGGRAVALASWPGAGARAAPWRPTTIAGRRR